MKTWTVMLIPHDRGDRRSFELSALHVYAIAGAFILSAFLTGFFYQRYQVAQAQAAQWEHYAQTIPALPPAPAVAVPSTGGIDAAAIEAEVRSEYEARDAAITAELSRLYDLEAEVRTRTGLPPRDQDEPLVVDVGGGKGGPPSIFVSGKRVESRMLRPPAVIYGLSNPSADLIVQEKMIRIASLENLLQSLEIQRDQIERIPSSWPSAHRSRKLSSTFGLRRDPFNGRVRHHDGLDISAEHGTPILATAKGTVKFAGWGAYYGNYVEIDHGNGLTTLFAHMSSILVTEGQEVDRGETIGRVGSTGRASGAHIHYEVHVNGQAVDPQRYVGR